MSLHCKRVGVVHLKCISVSLASILWHNMPSYQHVCDYSISCQPHGMLQKHIIIYDKINLLKV